MTQPFSPDGAYFNHSFILVLCNRIATMATAATSLFVAGGWADAKPVAPLTSYIAVSLANVVATACQYEALKYVSFAAQTVAKCLKPVPVMVWGLLALRRTYTKADVGVAVAVVTGCYVFMADGVASMRASSSTSTTTLIGFVLLASYLAADGLTSTLQDRMFDKTAVSAANQVLYVSLFSSATSLAGLASGRGGIPAAVSFCKAHPEAMCWIAGLAAIATASSFAITTTIKRHGALVLSLAMTVRQLGSVFVSAATYGDQLTARQVAGAGLVFGSLLWKGVAPAAK